MTIEWNRFEEKFPDKEGKLIVLIEGTPFFANSIKIDGFHIFDFDKIYFTFEKKFSNFSNDFRIDSAKECITNQKWLIPKHFKDPTHWAYLDMPKK